MKLNTGSLTFLQEGDDILLTKVFLTKDLKAYNGIETLIDEEQSLERKTIKEIYNQIKVSVYPEDLQNVGNLTIKTANFEGKIFSELKLTLFVVKHWQGEPQATAGVVPVWFGEDDIPYGSTIDNFKYWLPELLEGKRVFAEILYRENIETKVTELSDVILR